MSKTFASKPSVAAAGRGRGTGSANPVNPGQVNPRNVVGRQTGTALGTATGSSVVNRNINTRVNQPVGTRPAGATTTMAGQPQETEPEGAPQDLGQRMTYQGGYTRVAPNQQRRQQISDQARREEEQYEQFKEKNKLTHVNYVGTAGGGEAKEADVRRRMAQEHSHAKVQSLQKRQQWTAEKKMKEDEEFGQRKANARRQTQMNEKKREEDHRSRSAKLDEDRRRTNAAFLDRLEKQSRAQGVAGTTGSVQPPDNTSPTRSTRKDTGGAPLAVRQSPSSRVSVPPRSHREDISLPSSRQPSQTSLQSNSRLSSRSSQQPDLERRSQALLAMFPQYDRDYLMEILIQVDYSVDAAIDLLQS